MYTLPELEPNFDLRHRARSILQDNWWPCISITLIYLIVQFVLNRIPIIGSPISFIISGPLNLGFAIFYLNFIRSEDPDYNDFFAGFQDFGRALAAIILLAVFILAWAVLLVIPGIIAAYRYSMTFYILSDNPDISAIDALRLSSDMMEGAKLKLFQLHLSFIGWALLTALTAGVGQVLLIPYVMTSQAYFYENLKAAYEADVYPVLE